jgi:hypothetical protein
VVARFVFVLFVVLAVDLSLNNFFPWFPRIMSGGEVLPVNKIVKALIRVIDAGLKDAVHNEFFLTKYFNGWRGILVLIAVWC